MNKEFFPELAQVTIVFVDMTLELNEVTEDIIDEQGLLYIAGYVAQKFWFKYPFLGINTRQLEQPADCDWVQYLSKGYLTYPSDGMLFTAKAMEVEFNAFHGPELLNQTTGIFTKVTGNIVNQLNVKRGGCNSCVTNKTCRVCLEVDKIPEEVIMALVWKRQINIDIKQLNEDRRYTKKLIKFIPK